MLSDILRFGSCKNVQMELVFSMSDFGVCDAMQSQVQTLHGRVELTEGAFEGAKMTEFRSERPVPSNTGQYVQFSTVQLKLYS